MGGHVCWTWIVDSEDTGLRRQTFCADIGHASYTLCVMEPCLTLPVPGSPVHDRMKSAQRVSPATR